MVASAESGTLTIGARPMSSDGRYVVHRRAASEGEVIELWDRMTGISERIAPQVSGVAEVGVPSISANGSTVWYTASSGEVGPGLAATGRELFRFRLADASTSRVEVPGWILEAPVTGLSVSGDGALVVFGDGTRVVEWSAAGGFRILLDDGTRTHEVSAASLSSDAEFLTLLRITPVGSEGLREDTYLVLDRVTGSLHTSWPGPRWNPAAPHQRPFEFKLVATTDDGEAIFHSRPEGPTLWLTVDGAYTVAGGWVTGASPSGRFFAFTGHPELVPPSEAGASTIRDRATNTLIRVSGPALPTTTVTLSVSDDGRYVLFHSHDPALVATPGLHVWDRGA